MSFELSSDVPILSLVLAHLDPTVLKGRLSCFSVVIFFCKNLIRNKITREFIYESFQFLYFSVEIYFIYAIALV